jgi:hypothetical protein
MVRRAAFDIWKGNDMIGRKRAIGLLSIGAAASLSSAVSASSVEFDIAANNSDTAKVFFTSATGKLDVTVVNTSNLTAAVITDAISQIKFTLGGGFSISGLTELVGTGGFNAQKGVSAPWTLANGTFFDDTGTFPQKGPDQWIYDSSLGGLNALGGGNPFNMILPATGTSTGDGNSLANGDAYLLGTTEFVLSVTGGMTSSTALSISNVTVGFGTKPEYSGSSNTSMTPSGGVPTPLVVAVPLPTAFWSGAVFLGALSIGGALRKKFAH